jgi:hypothetical protein
VLYFAQAEQQSVPDMLAKGGKQAFVYNPTLLSGGQQQTGVKSFGAAGSSSSRMARQFPALAGATGTIQADAIIVYQTSVFSVTIATLYMRHLHV